MPRSPGLHLWATRSCTVRILQQVCRPPSAAIRTTATWCLEGRLRQALVTLNPDLPADALEDTFRKLTRTDPPSQLERNRALHRMLVDGVTVEYRRKDGSIAGAQAKAIDFDKARNNDWLAVNQYSVAEG